MNFSNTPIIHVSFLQKSKPLSVGRLILKDRKIFFEYSLDFLKTGIELSPFKLPLKAGLILCEDRLFEGLFGVFNDSLPDGWGRLLLDRKLMSLGINPHAPSPLDRLGYVGSHGMGALIYEPEIESSTPLPHKNFDEIAEEAKQFQENNNDTFVDDLLTLNRSSAGARPKILVNINGEDWIVKFQSSSDPKDVGPIEYAYHLMAKKAHLDVPEAKLFPSKKGPGYFGVKRFDRIENQRLHMHTVSGLLHADHRIPSLDYQTIMKAALWLTKDHRACEKLFRMAVFNVLCYNRDDHAKNFSFLMDQEGKWSISPAYDLTFSSGPAGEHCSTIMGEGKNPTAIHLLKLAKLVDIKKETALKILEEVKNATTDWNVFAKNVGVSPTSAKTIDNAILNQGKVFRFP